MEGFWAGGSRKGTIFIAVHEMVREVWAEGMVVVGDVEGTFDFGRGRHGINWLWRFGEK